MYVATNWNRQLSIAVQSIVSKAFSSQNLVPSSFAWGEDIASFGSLQASERERNSSSSNVMCNFRHLVLLLLEQREAWSMPNICLIVT